MRLSAPRRGSEHPNAKLSPEQAEEILTRTQAGEKMRAVAKEYPASRETVRRIAHGYSYRDH